MTRPYIPDDVRQRVAQVAPHRCGYCLTMQEYTAMPMHVEHIIPIAAGGASTEDNLWLACPLCNGYKGVQTHYQDAETGQLAALFHPRQQIWSDHFEWSDDGLQIIGKTPCGRVMVLALKLNNEFLTRARHRWVLAGWHPPD